MGVPSLRVACLSARTEAGINEDECAYQKAIRGECQYLTIHQLSGEGVNAEPRIENTTSGLEDGTGSAAGLCVVAACFISRVPDFKPDNSPNGRSEDHLSE